MVEPSAEASFPTMMLVQDSNNPCSDGDVPLSDWTPVQLTESKTRISKAKSGKDHFLTGHLLSKSIISLCIFKNAPGTGRTRTPVVGQPGQ
jgi:hypothetical protein